MNVADIMFFFQFSLNSKFSLGQFGMPQLLKDVVGKDPDEH